MKNLFTKTLAIATTVIMAFGVFAVMPQAVIAQTCSAGDTPGNLSGYATTDNIGKIYMSTQSWNDDASVEGHATSTYSFYVNYDRNNQLWSGRGWNAYVGWVDFGETDPSNSTSRQAEMESISNDPDAWGGWNPIIDLSGVSYTTDPGGFVGFGTNGEYTIDGGGSGDDDLVGAGNVDFSNVILDDQPCDERVDLTLNNVNTLYRQNCDISAPTIRWTTTGIVSGSCESHAGPWLGGLGVSKPDENLAGDVTAVDITSTNSPEAYVLKCTGSGSGANVFGEAYASCGTSDPSDPSDSDPIDPTTGIVIPEFKEV